MTSLNQFKDTEPHELNLGIYYNLMPHEVPNILRKQGVQEFDEPIAKRLKDNYYGFMKIGTPTKDDVTKRFFTNTADILTDYVTQAKQADTYLDKTANPEDRQLTNRLFIDSMGGLFAGASAMWQAALITGFEVWTPNYRIIPKDNQYGTRTRTHHRINEEQPLVQLPRIIIPAGMVADLKKED